MILPHALIIPCCKHSPLSSTSDMGSVEMDAHDLCTEAWSRAAYKAHSHPFRRVESLTSSSVVVTPFVGASAVVADAYKWSICI